MPEHPFANADDVRILSIPDLARLRRTPPDCVDRDRPQFDLSRPQ